MHGLIPSFGTQVVRIKSMSLSFFKNLRLCLETTLIREQHAKETVLHPQQAPAGVRQPRHFCLRLNICSYARKKNLETWGQHNNQRYIQSKAVEQTFALTRVPVVGQKVEIPPT